MVVNLSDSVRVHILVTMQYYVTRAVGQHCSLLSNMRL